MKKVILVFCFIPYTAFCQLSCTFEGGGLSGWIQTASGHWKADTASALSGSYSLHHVFDNIDAGTDQVGIRLKGLRPDLAVTTWSFTLRHGTDPSSSNNWAVFLMSDNDPSSMLPGAQVNGYAVGVNLNGYDDTLRLWKFLNGNPTAVKAFPLNWQTDIGTLKPAVVTVSRDIPGNWTLSVSDVRTTFPRIAHCEDNELFGVHWLGLFYRYTSSRDRLIWIDNISVEGLITEPLPPAIIAVNVKGDSSIDVAFSKEISALSVIPRNFTLQPGNIHPSEAILKNSHTLSLVFGYPFANKSSYRLFAENVCDKDSLCAGELSFEFVPAFAERGDVIITEIMADPSPPVSLPEKEYIEISNVSEYPYSLEGWKLCAGNTFYSFPASMIFPGQSLILCQDADTALFGKYGKTSGFRSFPVISNEGNILMLISSKGKMIHLIEYSGDWYGDRFKESGGWSLEMVDTRYPFFSEGNWSASLSSEGGTPGKQNSVAASNPDISFRGIINIFPEDSMDISLMFSEPLRDPGILIHDLKIKGPEIVSISQDDLSGMRFRLKLNSGLMKGRIYTLSAGRGITDFAGNLPLTDSCRFGLTEEAEADDIRFNEIMFNPLPGDEDFLEFFNVSRKTVNARDLYLVSVNDETAQISDRVSVCDTDRCLIPGLYYTITLSRQDILKRYPYASPSNIFQVKEMPSMPDDKGHLRLYSSKEVKIDELSYSEKMHFSLLSGFEGISLEKIRPDLNSGDRNSWHSASEPSGWGTPGRYNSVMAEPETGSKSVTLSATRITPDNDGQEDELVMDFSLDDLSNVINVEVFDESGNLVRRVARNTYTARQFSIVWDGTADDGSLVDSGIYVILITGYDSTGKTFRWKKVCTVIRR